MSWEKREGFRGRISDSAYRIIDKITNEDNDNCKHIVPMPEQQCELNANRVLHINPDRIRTYPCCSHTLRVD